MFKQQEAELNDERERQRGLLADLNRVRSELEETLHRSKAAIAEAKDKVGLPARDGEAWSPTTVVGSVRADSGMRLYACYTAVTDFLSDAHELPCLRHIAKWERESSSIISRRVFPVRLTQPVYHQMSSLTH